MTKKSFKDNPAFQFLSTATAADEQQEEQQPVAEVGATTLPIGRRRRESKSRRLQLLVTPTLFGKISKAAEAGGYSLNEYANMVLEKATKEG